MYFWCTITFMTCFVYFDHFIGSFDIFLFTIRYRRFKRLIVCAPWNIKCLTHCLNRMVFFLVMNKFSYFSIFYFLRNAQALFLIFHFPLVILSFVFVIYLK